MSLIKENSPFVGLLSAVWIYLLGLCLLIGYLVVPVENPEYSYFFTLLIGVGKIIISMAFILLWLLSWYKILGYIFIYEQSIALKNSESKP